ncbi:MAG: hypothetical protein KAH48_07000 [Chlorobi bacterium]|nr:hypothetical protein [Chlorobiota bacterium]
MISFSKLVILPLFVMLCFLVSSCTKYDSGREKFEIIVSQIQQPSGRDYSYCINQDSLILSKSNPDVQQERSIEYIRSISIQEAEQYKALLLDMKYDTLHTLYENENVCDGLHSSIVITGDSIPAKRIFLGNYNLYLLDSLIDRINIMIPDTVKRFRKFRSSYPEEGDSTTVYRIIDF